jgi:hypothetical protein
MITDLFRLKELLSEGRLSCRITLDRPFEKQVAYCMPVLSLVCTDHHWAAFAPAPDHDEEGPFVVLDGTVQERHIATSNWRYDATDDVTDSVEFLETMPSRIPEYGGPLDLLSWVSEMTEQGLLFHPDDDPADITPGFTYQEVEELNSIIPALRRDWGDRLYGLLCAYAGRSIVKAGAP